MTYITFTYYATRMADGRHCVHLYLGSGKTGDFDASVRDERKAEKDAVEIIKDIVGDNADDTGERLLMDGEPPQGAFPVFMFVIGVTWSAKLKLAHYSRVCHQRVEMGAAWNPVAALGMEQYELTMSVLRKREKAEVKAREMARDMLNKEAAA